MNKTIRMLVLLEVISTSKSLKNLARQNTLSQVYHSRQVKTVHI